MEPTKPAATDIKPFLNTVAAPLVWIGIGYLLATLVQRPRRHASV